MTVGYKGGEGKVTYIMIKLNCVYKEYYVS